MGVAVRKAIVRAAEVKVGHAIRVLSDDWMVRSTHYVEKLGVTPRMSMHLVSTDRRFETWLDVELGVGVDVVGECEHKTTVDDCCNGWCERCLDCGRVHI